MHTFNSFIYSFFHIPPILTNPNLLFYATVHEELQEVLQQDFSDCILLLLVLYATFSSNFSINQDIQQQQKSGIKKTIIEQQKLES